MNVETHYIALTVKDIATSRDFYAKLGFKPSPGCDDFKNKWMILVNGNIHIGIYEGMFPKNILTFNPRNVRAFYKKAKNDGLVMDEVSKSMSDESGPCSFMLTDPDGNPILFDQHH